MGASTFDIPCTNCGAKLTVDGSTRTPVCSFCGTHNVLSPEVWREVAPPPPANPTREVVIPSPNIGLWIGIGVAPLVITAVVFALVFRHHPTLPAMPSPYVGPTAFAAPQAPCNGTKAACSPDGKSFLECEHDSLVVTLTCKGPKGCRATDHGKSVTCDYTRAEENDPCNVKDWACSTDGKMELRCDGEKFIAAHACGGPEGCTISLGNDGQQTLSCDDHIAPENAPCVDDGRFACSSDMKSLLRCTRGKFVRAKTCKGPCSLAKDRMADTTSITCRE